MMSIFKRFSDVVRANINALIDKAEDPEKMANQIIMDLEKLQREATQGVAATIAEEKRLKRLVEQNRAEMEKWEARAIDCLKRGDEALAREALAQKQRFEADFANYCRQHEAQVEQVNALKENLRQLNEKIEEAKRRRDAIIARSKAARTQSAISQAMSETTTGDLLGKLDKMEEKVQQKEAMAEAYAELSLGDDIERRFREAEKQKSVDEELAALKEKLNQE
jgi:phage shock protein A